MWGDILVLGSNKYGQLGLGKTTKMIKDTPKVLMNCKDIRNVVCSCDSTYILRKQQLQVCGRNFFGQLSIGNKNDQFVPVTVDFQENIKSIHVGGVHVVVLTGTRFFLFYFFILFFYFIFLFYFLFFYFIFLFLFFYFYFLIIFIFYFYFF